MNKNQKFDGNTKYIEFILWLRDHKNDIENLTILSELTIDDLESEWNSKKNVTPSLRGLSDWENKLFLRIFKDLFLLNYYFENPFIKRDFNKLDFKDLVSFLFGYMPFYFSNFDKNYSKTSYIIFSSYIYYLVVNNKYNFSISKENKTLFSIRQFDLVLKNYVLANIKKIQKQFELTKTEYAVMGKMFCLIITKEDNKKLGTASKEEIKKIAKLRYERENVLFEDCYKITLINAKDYIFGIDKTYKDMRKKDIKRIYEFWDVYINSFIRYQNRSIFNPTMEDCFEFFSQHFQHSSWFMKKHDLKTFKTLFIPFLDNIAIIIDRLFLGDDYINYQGTNFKIWPKIREEIVYCFDEFIKDYKPQKAPIVSAQEEIEKLIQKSTSYKQFQKENPNFKVQEKLYDILKENSFEKLKEKSRDKPLEPINCNFKNDDFLLYVDNIETPSNDNIKNLIFNKLAKKFLTFIQKLKVPYWFQVYDIFIDENLSYVQAIRFRVTKEGGGDHIYPLFEFDSDGKIISDFQSDLKTDYDSKVRNEIKFLYDYLKDFNKTFLN